VKRLTSVMTVEEVGSLDQLRLCVGPVGMQDAILHIALGRHDDEQNASIGQAKELNLTEGRLAAARRGDNAGEVCELGQDLRRVADQRLGTVGGKLILELGDFA